MDSDIFIIYLFIIIMSGFLFTKIIQNFPGGIRDGMIYIFSTVTIVLITSKLIPSLLPIITIIYIILIVRYLYKLNKKYDNILLRELYLINRK